MCLGSATAWDHQRKIAIRRKPAKYHFTNLLAAVSWAPSHPDSVSEFRSLTPQCQGAWLEWAVAQELWRRAAVAGEDFPERMYYWQGGGHELDFVLAQVSQSTHGILRKLLHDLNLEKCSRYLPGYPCAFSKSISHNILRIMLALDCETWVRGESFP